MSSDKERILAEIKRVAAANDGVAPGKGSFERISGIKATKWEGRYWTKWSDALVEAGLTPNRFGTPAYDKEVVLKKVANFTRELGHVPNRNEMRLKKRSDPDLPSSNTLRKILGNKEGLVSKLLDFVNARPEWEDLVEILEKEKRAFESRSAYEVTDDSHKLGYVYLIQHGQRREYKIGFTRDVLRREGELSIQLPEQVTPVHFIETDDPSGVETYWHRRFADKRKKGEWFELSAVDVKAFKRWKKIY